MSGKMPLFVVEEQDESGGWVPIDLRHGRLHPIVGDLERGPERLPRRAKRVKTLKEADALAVTTGCITWVAQIASRVIWV